MDYSLPGSSVHGIFWQEYWSGLPFPSPEDLPNPGIEPTMCPALQADTLPPSEPPGRPGILIGIALNPEIALGGMNILTIFSAGPVAS